jgi:serine/threonine-protein kinase HipA
MATTSSGRLGVWMNGRRVGTWSHGRRGGDVFAYDPSWIDAAAARVLSLSLPFVPGNRPHRGAVVEHYFDNLLPDSDAIRRRLRSRFAADSTGAFDLLAAIGRDCVGAVQFLPEGEAPGDVRRIEAEPLDESGVEAVLAAATSTARPSGWSAEEDDFRISIAGAQEKTALLFHQDRWCRPLGATPTTHIFKLPLGLVGNLRADLRDSVENEWLCLRLLAHFGLGVASAQMLRFGAHRVLAVERFDRAWQADGGWIARLPQEDFCQALGQPSSLKYEADGGPGMRDVFRVLETSARARTDKETFLRAQILFWMLAATDGHAKNFSLFHERGGTYRLTPLYDVLSAWPIVGAGPGLVDERKLRLAMAVRSSNAHWKWSEILPRHWDAVARSAGLGDAQAVTTELAAKTPTVISAVRAELPPDFPAGVSEPVFTGLERSARRLLEHVG